MQGGGVVGVPISCHYSAPPFQLSFFKLQSGKWTITDAWMPPFTLLDDDAYHSNLGSNHSLDAVAQTNEWRRLFDPMPRRLEAVRRTHIGPTQYQYNHTQHNTQIRMVCIVIHNPWGATQTPVFIVSGCSLDKVTLLKES